MPWTVGIYYFKILKDRLSHIINSASTFDGSYWFIIHSEPIENTSHYDNEYPTDNKAKPKKFRRFVLFCI